MKALLTRLPPPVRDRIARYEPSAVLRTGVACAALLCLTAGTGFAQDEPPGTVATYMQEFKLADNITAGATELFKYMAYLVPIAFALTVGWKVVRSMRRVG